MLAFYSLWLRGFVFVGPETCLFKLWMFQLNYFTHIFILAFNASYSLFRIHFQDNQFWLKIRFLLIFGNTKKKKRYLEKCWEKTATDIHSSKNTTILMQKNTNVLHNKSIGCFFLAIFSFLCVQQNKIKNSRKWKIFLKWTVPFNMSLSLQYIIFEEIKLS